MGTMKKTIRKGIPQRQNHMIGEIMATSSKKETSQTLDLRDESRRTIEKASETINEMARALHSV